MNKITVAAALLFSVITYAQEKDSVKSKSIEEIIINSISRKSSSYTNKMPLKAIEDQQVFTSVGKGILENQSIFTIDDAYRNVTGLQKMWNPTGRAGDGGSFVVLRGFSSNNSLRNGLVSPISTTIDAVNLETLEVLKGPSGTLYGSNIASYGGLINRITKKPSTIFGGTASLMAGSYNTYRAQADINTPLTKDKKLLFRLNTAYTNEGTFQKQDAKNSYFAFAPSFTYNVNDKLQFNVDYEMFNSRASSESFFFYLSPGVLGGIDNMHDLEAKGLNYKESYTGKGLYTTSRVNTVFGQINYQITDQIRSSTNINSSHSYSDGFSPYFSVGLNALDQSLEVSRYDQSTRGSKSSHFQIQQNFNSDYYFGNGMRNRTVAGFDYLKTSQRFRYTYLNNGAFDTVSATNGDYSGLNDRTLAAAYQLPGNTGVYNSDGDNHTYSGYISNVFTPITGLNIAMGIRYENNDFQGGEVFFTKNDPYNQAAWSPKAGLVYEIIKDQFSVFGNYQNSFKSNGYYTTNISGAMALSDPERANQFEGGFKANLINGKINATVSYYDIKVKNMLVSTGEYTPSFQSVQAQAGAIRSKGMELEVNAYLVKGFSVIGGVSYNDITDLSTGLRPNTGGSPWLANFNASYQFVEGALQGLGFGVGGNYANDNKILNSPIDGTFTLPKYLVMNANAFYDTKKYRIGLKVDNFTNQHYWIGFTTGNPQKLINALGTFTYKF